MEQEPKALWSSCTTSALKERCVATCDGCVHFIDLEKCIRELSAKLANCQDKLDASAKAYADIKMERDCLRTDLQQKTTEVASLRKELSKLEISHSNAYSHWKEAERKASERKEEVRKLAAANGDLCNSTSAIELKLHQQAQVLRYLSKWCERHKASCTQQSVQVNGARHAQCTHTKSVRGANQKPSLTAATEVSPDKCGRESVQLCF